MRHCPLLSKDPRGEYEACVVVLLIVFLSRDVSSVSVLIRVVIKASTNKFDEGAGIQSGMKP